MKEHIARHAAHLALTDRATLLKCAVETPVIGAALAALVGRIDQLETVLRKLHKDNERECEQSIDSRDIEALFECRECLDSGITGSRPEDDAPLACTATAACRAKAGL